MTRGNLTMGTDNDRVLLRFESGRRHMTAVLSVDEARALSAHLLDVAKVAAAAGPPVGNA